MSMGTYDYAALCELMNNMSSWKTVAICGACADKVAPIIHGMGLKNTSMLVHDCLEYIWTVAEQRRTGNSGRLLIDSLHSTPEFSLDDNSYLPFAVHRALDFVNLALLASISSSPSLRAEQSLSLMLDLAESFDISLATFPAPHTGVAVELTLRSSEERSQQRIVNTLDAAEMCPEDAIVKVRREAHLISCHLKHLLPVYAYDYLRA